MVCGGCTLLHIFMLCVLQTHRIHMYRLHIQKVNAKWQPSIYRVNEEKTEINISYECIAWTAQTTKLQSLPKWGENVLRINEKKNDCEIYLLFFGWVCCCFDCVKKKKFVFEATDSTRKSEDDGLNTLLDDLLYFARISFSVSLSIPLSRWTPLWRCVARWTFYLFRNLRI